MTCEGCGGRATKDAVDAAVAGTDDEGRAVQTIRCISCPACADGHKFVVTRVTAHEAWGFTRKPAGVALKPGRYEDLLPEEVTTR